MEKINYCYNDLKLLADNIKHQMKIDNYVPDVIISPLRGGLFLSQEILYFNEELGKNIKFMTADIKVYNKTSITEPLLKNSPELDLFLTNNIRDNTKILIVDDLYSSGTTIEYLKNYIQDFSHLNKMDIKVATFMLNTNKDNKSDYYGEKIDTSNWIVFPWDN